MGVSINVTEDEDGSIKIICDRNDYGPNRLLKKAIKSRSMEKLMNDHRVVDDFVQFSCVIPEELYQLTNVEDLIGSKDQWRKIFNKSLHIIKNYMVVCYVCANQCCCHDNHDKSKYYFRLTLESDAFLQNDPDGWVVQHPVSKKCVDRICEEKQIKAKWQQHLVRINNLFEEPERRCKTWNVYLSKYRERDLISLLSQNTKHS